MADVFISHVEEDASTAITIASGLESAGFSTWYYERDAVPGVSYLVQVGEAIDQSSPVVLLISSNSLGSHQVTTEVVRAHEAKKHILPVLADVTHHDFQRRQPEWRAAVGAATSVSLGDRDIDSVVRALVVGLVRLRVHQSPSVGSPVTPATITLRSRPDSQLGAGDGALLIRKRGYFETNMNPGGHGLAHQYIQTQDTILGQDLVEDRATGLVWQRCGSTEPMTYADAKQFVHDLTNASEAGDWRLPTLDEAMSLMEARVQSNDLHIAVLFDSSQSAIWTSDGTTALGVWIVNYEFGYCEIVPQTPWYKYWFRAVRSGGHAVDEPAG